MSCCGGKRTELRNSIPANSKPERAPGNTLRTPVARKPAPPATTAAPRPAVPVQPGMVTLRYLAGAPIQVTGPATRTIYRFSREAPLQRIARADAEPLLATGHFRLEA
jgi:hypothetical protein